MFYPKSSSLCYEVAGWVQSTHDFVWGEGEQGVCFGQPGYQYKVQRSLCRWLLVLGAHIYHVAHVARPQPTSNMQTPGLK